VAIPRLPLLAHNCQVPGAVLVKQEEPLGVRAIRIRGLLNPAAKDTAAADGGITERVAIAPIAPKAEIDNIATRGFCRLT
jgi:hypothetical protein